MPIDFDAGYPEPFATLCRNYPGTSVYPQSDFRTEWGPIFHRGRLDGSAKILVIGQDPAQSENVLRRILVGPAGQRTQGLLAKLGLTRSYVLINTYLYSVAGGTPTSTAKMNDYRNQWIDAIFAGGNVQAVLTLGSKADGAWSKWKAANTASPHRLLPYAHVTHPTYPESAAGNNTTLKATLTTALLANWNTAIATLAPAITSPDIPQSGIAYGTAWKLPDDNVQIPSIDLPAGIPDWMTNRDRWAKRGPPASKARAIITITVPDDLLPSTTVVPHMAAIRATGAAMRSSAPPTPLAIEARATPPHRAVGLLAISGHVVTMRSPSSVLKDHTIYIRDGLIVDIRPIASPKPDGFAGVSVHKSGGLIFPGLIDLHNHLAYDALPLWKVPKKFTNRDQWSGLPAYRTSISGPMGVIADIPGVLAALCRYVECKAILGGATTCQGIALVNHNNVRTFFKGLARNAESTDDAELPAAQARIGDVMAKDLAKFRKTLNTTKSCYLLHLSEGRDASARAHFLALKSGSTWALSSKFAGIHAAALTAADFKILADHGGAMVWSPLSNLLLYGETADVAAAKNAGVRIGLGPDWSPSGSKNMLGELKAARAYSDTNGAIFTDEELVAMATREAASILGWSNKLGTLEAGKIADLLVIAGSAADPYRLLLEAAETDINLLVIGGVRRYGTAALMKDAGGNLEDITVGKKARKLNLSPGDLPTEHDPNLEQLTLAEATKRLRDALAGLKTLSPAAPHLRAMSLSMNDGWRLALDETEHTGMEMRELVGLSASNAKRGLTRPQAVAAAAPHDLKPIDLDPLTVADEKKFVASLKAQTNLPAAFVKKLAAALS